MGYQSLYRRYRPQRFGEVIGQDHISRTLRNAVRDNRVAHSYLFSGPRGTGKTSTARILAKALNCTAVEDGEPCGICESCQQITAGSSLDVMELDAASNNRVEDMRDLLGRVALGSPGRSKVYIVDEVHMLSAAAANALLKTLEEPPGHVYFVLATTDPQRVLPTIRSRTQHFQFRLLPPDLLLRHLQWVVNDACLEVAPEAIALVAQRGSGSVRDALSALDQVIAAGGGAEREPVPADELVEALCDRDAPEVLRVMAEASSRGHDPRQIARELVEHLRNAFLVMMARSLVSLPDESLAHLEDQGRRLGPAATVRAIEVLGDALVEMRDTVEPRIALEVALVRIARPEADTSPAALLERIEGLERQLAGHVTAPIREAARQAVPETPPGSNSGESSTGGPRSRTRLKGPGGPARAALGGDRDQGVPQVERPAPPAAPPSPRAAPRERSRGSTPAAPATGTAGDLPSRDEIALSWGDELLTILSPKARARLGVGRWVSVEDGTAHYALPNVVHRDRCEEFKAEMEQVLASRFGRRLPVRLVVDTEPPVGDRTPPPREPEDLEHDFDLTELSDAPAVPSGVEHLKRAFPGATRVEESPNA